MARGGPLETLYNRNPLTPVCWGLGLMCALAYYYYNIRSRNSHAYQRVATSSGGTTSPSPLASGPLSTKFKALVNHLSGNGAHWWVLILWSLFAMSIVGFFFGEVYHDRYQCTTSVGYQRDLVALTRHVLTILDREQIPYWMDFASLLAILRHTPVPWDHDHDISIVYPTDKARVMQQLAAAGDVSFDATRDLIQLYYITPSGRKGPHIDLWLWTICDEKGEPISPVNLPAPHDTRADGPQMADGTALWLSSPDKTLKYNPRAYTDMLPPAKGWWAQMQHNTSIPAESVTLADRSFGSTWNVPQWNRADCFHNFWSGRWMY